MYKLIIFADSGLIRPILVPKTEKKQSLSLLVSDYCLEYVSVSLCIFTYLNDLPVLFSLRYGEGRKKGIPTVCQGNKS